ncbi:MAG TPA: YbaK/EbsC family protein [Candidatus Dormibacteraeota bacterium]|nr:YbaK/EbsC family protein [Candidatus Dormibacteraeota bacterium]
MACLEKLERYLHEHRVPYRVERHRAAFTAQEIATAEHVPGRRFAKVVMAHADGELIMLTLPAPYLVDTDLLSTVVGKTARLAEEAEFAPRFPDCEPGAMPAFGNLYGIPVLVEADLATGDPIVMQAGDHRVTVELAYRDWERLVRPTVAHFSHPSSG